MSLSEIKKYKEDINDSVLFYDKKIDYINDKIKEYEETNNSIKNIVSYENDIEYVKNKIKQLKEIVQISNHLIEIVLEDEESISLLINTYNIYVDELFIIISKYEEMDEEQKVKYEEKLNNLFNNFKNHLENLETKIILFKEHDIDFDINFLNKKLLEKSERDDVDVQKQIDFMD